MRDFAAEQAFYEEVAGLLANDQHVYSPFPYEKKTRWNNRKAGNGRYPGNGLVRIFSPTLVQVKLRMPKLTGTFTSLDAALAAIRAAI
jgi:hypothetical protein